MSAGLETRTRILHAELGERIDYAGTGHRCPSDNSFMVIGDSAATRRYVCPKTECGEVGPTVTTPGGDCGALKQPVSPEAKAEREMRIFRQFAGAAGLVSQNGRSCNPPYPDIVFTRAGEEKYIELAEITDEALAKRRASLLKGNPEGSFRYSQTAPLLKTIADKAAGSYETEGSGVDLLLYYEKQLPDVALLTRFLRDHTLELGKLEAPVGPFSAVLIFDTWTNSVLWRTKA